MKSIFSTLMLAGMLLASQSHAAVYRCEDAAGNHSLQDHPCENDNKQEQVKVWGKAEDSRKTDVQYIRELDQLRQIAQDNMNLSNTEWDKKNKERLLKGRGELIAISYSEKINTTVSSILYREGFNDDNEVTAAFGIECPKGCDIFYIIQFTHKTGYIHEKYKKGDILDYEMRLKSIKNELIRKDNNYLKVIFTFEAELI